MHRSILLTSMASSAVMGGCVGLLLWDSGAQASLEWWLIALALVLVARLVIGWRQAVAAPGARDDGQWLLWNRCGYAAHGVAWGLAGLALSPLIDQQEFGLLAFSVMVMGAGSLVLTAFDLVAALAFAAPAVAPVIWQLLIRRDGSTAGWWVIALLLLGAALISALRTYRMTRESVRLQLAEHAHVQRVMRSAEAAERAQRELAHTNLLLPLLLENTQQGYWATDEAGLTTNVNPAMCRLLGLSRDDVIGRPMAEFFQGADQQLMQDRILARGDVAMAGYEVTLVRPDGTRRYCHNNPTPLVDASGRRLGMVGLWTDITERREAELALRTYELVANSLTDLVSVVDEDEVYHLVNDAWCKAIGVARADAIGRRAIDVMPSMVTPERRRLMRECIDLREVRTARTRVDLPARPSRHVETIYYPYAAMVGAADARWVVVVSRDVTDQEEARQQTALSAEYLRRTLDATGDAIFASDVESPGEPVRFFNPQLLALWGIPEDRAASLTPATIMSHATALFADPQVEERLMDQIVASNEPHESKVPLRDGRVLLRRCVPARVADRMVRVWSFRDITAQDRALTIAKESEAQHRALINAFPGYITCLDERLVYTHVNARLAQRLGLSQEQIVGRTPAQVFGPERHAELRAMVARVLAGESVSYERNYAKDGAIGQIDQVTMAAGSDPMTGRPVFYAFGIDISARKRAEEQLRLTTADLARKTQELQLTLDHIDQGFVSMHDDGRIGVHNRRILELLNLPPSILKNGALYRDAVDYQAIHGDLEPDLGFVDIDGVRHHFQGGEDSVPDHYVRRTREGVVLEVRSHRLPGGGMVRTFSDVTAYFKAQQSLREVEAELRAVLEAFPGYISAVSQDLIYTYMNDRFASVLGVPAREASGRSVREVLGQDGAERGLAQSRKASTEGPQVVQVDYPATPARPRLTLEVTYVAGLARADGAQTFYAFGQDITARRVAEEALVAARDAAESASRAKSEFLASMSHELRTPLNAILGFSELFRTDPSLPPHTREGAAEMERAGQHLLALVDDVIDLARIEAGRLDLNLEAVDVGAVAEQCLAMVEPLARKRGIVLRCDIDTRLPVMVDRLRIRQVMLNLLSNAIKYNRNQGQVLVRVALQDDEVRVNVVDTGEGIPQVLRARLFSSFDRLGAERGKVQGAGIGLVITKRLVEAMGGSIGVDSEGGVGSVFWVQFRQATPPMKVGTAAAVRARS